MALSCLIQLCDIRYTEWVITQTFIYSSYTCKQQIKTAPTGSDATFWMPAADKEEKEKKCTKASEMDTEKI